jgi:hypothetical protein
MIAPLDQILGRALRAAGLEATDQLWQVSQAWPAALGEQLGSRAQPLRLTRGELLVSVPDAVWRQELSLLAPRIIARLNERLGSPVVQRLKLVGAAQAPPPTPEPRTRRLRSAPSAFRSAPLPARVPAEIGGALRDLWRARARRLAHDRGPCDQEED